MFQGFCRKGPSESHYFSFDKSQNNVLRIHDGCDFNKQVRVFVWLALCLFIFGLLLGWVGLGFGLGFNLHLIWPQPPRVHECI